MKIYSVTLQCAIFTPLSHRHVNKTGETPYHCQKKKALCGSGK